MRATRLLACENARPVRVLLPSSLGRTNRKDPAVCVSLSSYYNVKEPVGLQPKPQSRTHDGSKSPILSQRQSKPLEKSRGEPRFCPLGIARSRLVPQSCEQPAREGYLSSGLRNVKGASPRNLASLPSVFCSVVVTARPHSCPNARPDFYLLTAR